MTRQGEYPVVCEALTRIQLEGQVADCMLGKGTS